MKRIIVLFVALACFIIPFNTQAQDSVSMSYIYVDLKGAVLKPGVYRVSDNCRVFQLIEMAGGLRDEANTRYINLAKVLEDEIIIYVPYYEEESSDSTLVNINTASVNELISLDNIGVSTAERIIKYRQENGDFQSIEDIKNVSGIGESTYEGIKDYITV